MFENDENNISKNLIKWLKFDPLKFCSLTLEKHEYDSRFQANDRFYGDFWPQNFTQTNSYCARILKSEITKKFLIFG